MKINYNYFILNFCLSLSIFCSSAETEKNLSNIGRSIFDDLDFVPIDTRFETRYVEKLKPGGQIKKDPKLKYILQWTSSDHVPFLFMGVGQQGFIDRNCLYTNCYVTSFVPLLSDYTEFDAVLFSGPDVRHYSYFKLPQRRSPKQKYVFVSTESSESNPVFMDQFDGFFNWTWTYKLDSDLRWGGIVVTNLNRTVIGPKKSMHWIKRSDMLRVRRPLQTILSAKKKAVAWISSNCYTSSNRESNAKKLQDILRSQYELDLDIYGKCGEHKCNIDDEKDEEGCNEIIKRDYYFYLAYEESLSEDFVTEELLLALQNNAIPIVYGGANYSRFLPEGSYLDARELDVELLAAKINQLISNNLQYLEYFKWTNHYKYYSTLEHEETNEYCKMCALLNDKTKMKHTSIYENFQTWWNPKHYHNEIMQNKNKMPKGFLNKVFKFQFKDLSMEDLYDDINNVFKSTKRFFRIKRFV